jgi:phage terminase large subunit-like protein
MFVAGRGAGKTRSGTEWIRDNVKRGIRRIGLIAPTAADARDVMIEGSSGILEVCWEYDRDISYANQFTGHVKVDHENEFAGAIEAR